MANGRPRVKNLKSRVAARSNVSKLAKGHLANIKVLNDQKAQELMDSKMIQEDQGAIANLSDKPINKVFMANRVMQSLGSHDELSDV